jgi:hypothetical protein
MTKLFMFMSLWDSTVLFLFIYCIIFSKFYGILKLLHFKQNIHSRTQDSRTEDTDTHKNFKTRIFIPLLGTLEVI